MLAFWIRADLDEAAFRGDELRGFGPATLDVFKKEKLLKRGEDLRVVECGDCGNPHLEDVDVITDSPDGIPRAYIACGAGRVSVRLDDLQVWAIDFDRLAHLTRSALGLGGRIVQVATDRVWLLGSARLADKTRDVFLVRGIRWPDSLQLLVGNARLSTSPCPLILCMNRVPDDADWHGHERVVMSMSEFDWFGDGSQAVASRISAIVAELDRRHPAVEAAVFRKEIGTWLLSFEGATVHVPDTLVGVSYICELLRTPHAAIEAVQLAGVSVESSKLPALPGIPLADEATIKAVRAELVSRKIELAGLQKSDWARNGALKEEISKLEQYLGGVQTHQGQARKVAGTTQRARTSVTNAINRARDSISEQHPALGRHLKESIKTGTTPTYAPAIVPDWHF